MAQFDSFLKIDGIEGESQDAKHKGEIHIQSFSWGATNSGSAATGGGLGSGKVNFDDFTFSMDHQKASPKLKLACASGQHIPKAVFVCRKAGGDQQEFLKVTFSDLLVSHYTMTGGSAASLPTDHISMNFTKIEWEYKEQKADGTLAGSIKAGWNVKANQKV